MSNIEASMFFALSSYTFPPPVSGLGIVSVCILGASLRQITWISMYMTPDKMSMAAYVVSGWSTRPIVRNFSHKSRVSSKPHLTRALLANETQTLTVIEFQLITEKADRDSNPAVVPSCESISIRHCFGKTELYIVVKHHKLKRRYRKHFHSGSYVTHTTFDTQSPTLVYRRDILVSYYPSSKRWSSLISCWLSSFIAWGCLLSAMILVKCNKH